MKKIVFPLIISTFLFSCNSSKKKEYVSEKTIEPTQIHPGKKLMETNCYVCHSPSATMEDRIGPPMIAIKKHYISEETTKEQFTEAMQTWIKNPIEENAKMYGAVKNFGVMPKQPYPEETINLIAEYMYEYAIEQPEWFEEHFKEKKGKHNGNGNGQGKGKGKGKGKGLEMHKQQAEASFNTLPYDERGLQYALTTKAVLGKNLMGTIQKKGTLEALSFCNERAYPLTDSMSVVHNAIITRVSDKPRNPKNQANKEELTYIEAFKKDLKNTIEPKPIVTERNNKVQVYYPITTNTMCLQCHGQPTKNIEPTTLKKLALLYPNDKAIGYDINEVRGIWSITFDK